MSNLIRKTARVNGKKISAYGKTEAEAMKKLAAKIVEIERGEETVGGNTTVSAWYKKWLETYKKPKGLTPKSLHMYDEKYNNHIKPTIGHLKMEDVRDIHLQRILNDQAGKSESHLKKIRIVLQGMFRQARISRIILYDPSECREIPKATKKSRRSITREERKAILELAKTHPSGLWVLVLLYAGLRPGETFALVWNDIDFEKNEIHVHAAKESGSSRVKGPKTSSGYRDIPMRAELREALLKARGEPFDLVFKTRSGKMHNENSRSRLWNSFKRALDIHMGGKLKRNKIVKSVVADDLVPYCLRHTFCTDLQKAGVPINVAKELMGHSDIQTTANIYTHRDNALLHELVEKMDAPALNPVLQEESKTRNA